MSLKDPNFQAENEFSLPKSERPVSRDSNSTITTQQSQHTHSSHQDSYLPNVRSDFAHRSNRSISPSMSASSKSVSTASSKYQGRRYTGKLPISDIPELMELCQTFLKTRNITGLAMLARQAGLPLHLRCKIWPILLKYHPFVQNPYLEIDDNDDDDDDDDEEEQEEIENKEEEQHQQQQSEEQNVKDGLQAAQKNRTDDEEEKEQERKANGSSPDSSGGSSERSSTSSRKSSCKTSSNDDYTYKIPYKEIKFDLRKYLRSAERYKPKVLTLEVKDMFEIQEKIFDIIEHAVIKFLKKWGTIVHYNSALAWIALGLAEWVPPLPNSQFVLCGRDDVAKNGTKLRNIDDSYFESLNNSNAASDASSLFDSPFSLSPESATPLASPQNTPPNGFKPMSFAEIYERMVLVILHTPDPATIENAEISSPISVSKELKQLSLLPYTGGSITDRISFFLFCMRKLLPELHSYLAEEDCLNGDWILWWLKYAGSKVWSRYDRGRTWDLLLGYRTDCKNFESNMKALSELTPEQIRLLGPDLFWNPMENMNDDNTDESLLKNLKNLKKMKLNSSSEPNTSSGIIDDEEDGEREGEVEREDGEDFSTILPRDKHDRSLSVLTLMSKNRSPSLSVDKTPTLASLPLNSPHNPLSNLSDNELSLAPLDEIEPISQLPFSKINPHVQIIFISLAFLKSKEFTITELDQSEIKTLFGRLSSLRTDFGEMSSFVSTRDEPDDSSGNGLSNGLHSDLIDNNNTHVNDDLQMMITHHRKSNRDIENVLIEAGELWRRFLYINMIEETDLEKL